MSGGSFFLTLGGLGVSLAGFAGLIYAMASDPGERDMATARRFRSIVYHGFRVAVVGLAAFPAWELTGSQDDTMRIVSGVAIVSFIGFRSELAPGPAWSSSADRYFVIGLAVAQSLAWVANLVLASTGVAMALLVWTVIVSMGVFFSAVRAMDTAT